MTYPVTVQPLGRTTRVAIRLFPQWWREQYGAEVVDTLLELRQRRNGNLLDDFHLAARGLWLRARTSPSFWGGLVLLIVMLWTSGQGPNAFLVERYWPAVLTAGGSSAPFALPLAAVIAALQGHRHARRAAARVDARKRVSEAAWSMVPVLATLLLGYLVVVLLSLLTSGLPATGSPSALIVPLSFAGLALGAVAVGFALGAVLPPVVAVPVAGVLLYAWYSMPLDGAALAWRNVTGAGLTQCCLWVDVVPHPQAQLIAIVSGVALTAITLLLVAARPSMQRSVSFAGVAVSIMAILVAVAPSVSALGQASQVGRDLTELRCEGTSPQVCLWPEQDAAFGPAIRPVLTQAFERGVAAGLPMRAAVTPYVGGLSDGQRHESPINAVSMRLGDSDAAILASYGQAVYASESCAVPGAVDGPDFAGEQGVHYAIALLLGAEPAAALPRIEHSVEERLPSIAYTPAEVRDLIGVHNIAEARTTVNNWLASCDS
ncbi:hypothetical protein E3T55_11605 [Cryobacterium frigoriphilum]|uniref:Uncharacterized protein n=1 Tax=Cryobacterium frigoriphilum TaxID=1259150 RepID=A0A4R8ZZM1_9MICO|nr:hypothetical protein [Cryobacterium frigoriphilum]TFD49298.1 hypothetical protein E3T55_11605 [Cryobacterium frigoriphilum]